MRGRILELSPTTLVTAEQIKSQLVDHEPKAFDRFRRSFYVRHRARAFNALCCAVCCLGVLLARANGRRAVTRALSLFHNRFLRRKSCDRGHIIQQAAHEARNAFDDLCLSGRIEIEATAVQS